VRIKFILSQKTLFKIDFFDLKSTFGPKTNLLSTYRPQKSTLTNFFGPNIKLAPCKVGSKIAFMKCREMNTGAPFKIRQPELLFFILNRLFGHKNRLFRSKKIDFRVEFWHPPQNLLFSTSHKPNSNFPESI